MKAYDITVLTAKLKVATVYSTEVKYIILLIVLIS